jgi:hypothetical protein
MTNRDLRLPALAIAMSMLIGASLLAWVALSIKASLDAEKTLHAYRMLLDVIADCVDANNGRWPRSWDELVGVRNPGCAGFRWPEDVSRLKKRISIDFDLTTDLVVSTGVEHFTAVKQIGPHYGTDPGDVGVFLERLRKSADAEGGSATAQKGRLPQPAHGDRW